MKLIDIRTLSKEIHIKPKTIYAWIARERIPYYRLGKLIRFDLDEIQNWLKENHKDLVASSQTLRKK